MAEGEGKIAGFLSKDTAGLPNWAWILVVVAGVGAAYIVPKFFKGTSSSTGSTDSSGLGLAVDPTTGLPYAVEGLVPSGGLAGTGGTGGTPCPPPVNPNCKPGETVKLITDSNGCVTATCVKSGGTGGGGGLTSISGWTQTLRQLAAKYGETLQQLYSDNPELGNPNATSFPAGGSYNPDLAGNAYNLTLYVRNPQAQAQRAALKAQWPGAA